ncbi:hypothetical protein C8J42_101816 [Sphingomonas sp. PP-CE-1A-559]|nr:hypothetical protein C8J42_101816 [Sphingomonas sp. PP-CE-1A-559]
MHRAETTGRSHHRPDSGSNKTGGHATLRYPSKQPVLHHRDMPASNHDRITLLPRYQDAAPEPKRRSSTAQVRPAHPTPSAPKVRPNATLSWPNPYNCPARYCASVCTLCTSGISHDPCPLRNGHARRPPPRRCHDDYRRRKPRIPTSATLPRNAAPASALRALPALRMTPAPSEMATIDVLNGADATTITGIKSPAVQPAQRSRGILHQRLHFVHFRRSA